MSHNPHPYKPPQANWGEHPVVTPSVEKQQFMLTYFIAARSSGRVDDTPDGCHTLANTASDLYDRAAKITAELK